MYERRSPSGLSQIGGESVIDLEPPNKRFAVDRRRFAESREVAFTKGCLFVHAMMQTISHNLPCSFVLSLMVCILLSWWFAEAAGIMVGRYVRA